MGMTWRQKVQGVVLVVATLGVLAIAAGADYINLGNFCWFF